MIEAHESVIMELCNAQRDVGMLTERITWLQWRLEHLLEGDRDRPFTQTRLEMAEMQLEGVRTTLSRLYKEIYE